ncbi:uncharacterized protein KNAG_0C05280 [Huiozyma naganishii CBS 8797]|uniref:Uncharacterized protein n=1 Tax=Huiozyma naganishii (strain ATCC MYA-139 / BCRC 22969 / CBS 8797 / KCTC 17520 / NBRC 10181 / NCYC 3082 / Yp74L-3) TaxID=1071383 RepID=J7S6A0_HUIN7|nr:hypothetical protein KNAG_0C05280 [Kazachstania naganishii CBS 8797]CCK69626.1 hypothetical protein KNAG_0C05280 [Kazachstania naganishii CBS 8797]
MSGILQKTLSEVQPALRTTGMGIGNTHRRISLNWLPDNSKNPLVKKYTRKKKKRRRRRNSEQRSFRSLAEDFGSSVHEPHAFLEEICEEDVNPLHGELIPQDGELSRTISLPSKVSETPELSPPNIDWILEEHERRYSSVHNSDSEDHESPEPYPNREVRYNDFINKVQTQKMLYRNAPQHSPRRASLISVTSHGTVPSIFQEGLDEESLYELAHADVTFNSEAKVLASYSLPLMFTFLLEDIFPLVCSLTVGHLGKNELAAVSLASMTSNITLGFFEGIATSLDTLCPQAYGAGRYRSVGVHLQRCIAFSMVVYIPFALFWYFSEPILYYLIPEKELIKLTSQFLRVLIFGAPPYIFFENLKRYLQAQGIFDAGIYILTICAPINILMSYTLVWNKYIGIGFIGSAVAVVLNFWLMFTLMLLYIIKFNGRKCWGGFSKRAFTHWRDLAHLAASGVVMLEAEELSYELLTLFSAYFGTAYLAAQSAVSSIAALIYMIPFAIGISASTRIANFIGAKRTDFAGIAARVGISFSFIAGFTNCCILVLGRNFIANIFSKDEQVRLLISHILPVVGIVQNFDSLNAVSGSCLRGQGMQLIGSIVNFVGYYFFGIPLAMALSWFLDWKLYGLWIGIGCGMLTIGTLEAYFVLHPNWEKILHHADLRRAADEADVSDDEGYVSSSSSSSGSESDEGEPTERSPLLPT